MAFRDSASFGKRQEYIAVAELLKRGFDVYMTLVDDQQIDCIVRLEDAPPRYIDVQIKARSKTAKHPGTFAAMVIKDPRPNFFFIFYSEAADTYWVMPSLTIVDKANVGKSGKAEGKYRLDLTNTHRDGTVKPRPKWEQFQGAFDLLRAQPEKS
ncbi:hypothetical protein [Pelagibius sp.]|uniref:hypothetical protein n=1 Tax=Pelagibius sp. TaxID=1931238 RepID=UPI002616E81A|nr:hypothetical protein [Pelagibius sp.]